MIRNCYTAYCLSLLFTAMFPWVNAMDANDGQWELCAEVILTGDQIRHVDSLTKIDKDCFATVSGSHGGCKSKITLWRLNFPGSPGSKGDNVEGVGDMDPELEIRSIKFKPPSVFPLSRTCFASGSGDGKIEIWDKNANDEYSNQQSLSVDNGCIDVLKRIGENCFTSGSDGGKIHIWAHDNSEWVCRLMLKSDKPITQLVAINNGDYLVSAGDGYCTPGDNNYCIIIWKRFFEDDHYNYKKIQILPGHSARISSLISLGNGKFASGGYDSYVIIWQLCDDGEFEKLQKLRAYKFDEDNNCMFGHWVVALDRLDNDSFVSYAGNGGITIWKWCNWSNYYEVVRLNGNPGEVSRLLVLSPSCFVSGFQERIAGANSQFEQSIKIWTKKP